MIIHAGHEGREVLDGACDFTGVEIWHVGLDVPDVD